MVDSKNLLDDLDKRIDFHLSERRKKNVEISRMRENVNKLENLLQEKQILLDDVMKSILSLMENVQKIMEVIED